MIHFRKILLIILTIGLFISCSDDWLKPDPKSFYTPENVFVDKEGFESLLITMRRDLRSEHTGNLNYLVAEYATSDLGSPWSQLDFYNLTPNSSRYYPFLTFFTDVYGYIKNANVLISRIDDIEWSNEDDRNSILAEGLWFRAYWYYRLINTYGDVPFINEEITSPKLDFYTHSRWAILDKIEEDMEFAVQWLPENVGPGGVSRGAGEHLLTKIYLANLDYDKAIEASSKVINGPYELMTERFGVDAADPVRNLLWDLHRPKNFNITANTENILATVDRFEAPADARTTGLFTMRMYHPQWFQIQTLDSEGKPGMVASGPQYDSLGRGNCNVRLTDFYQYHVWSYKGQTWEDTQDLRRADINWIDIHEIMYNNPASVDYGKPVQIEYLANPIDTFKHIYAMPWYITNVPNDDPNAMPAGGHGDWYVFRLAETYLLRAEAYFWKGQLDLAAADINKVRARANAIPISSSEVTIDFIMDERARELFAEEPRHSELVRVSYILAKSNKDGYSLSSFSDKNYYYDRVMRHNKTYEQKIDLLNNVANMAPFHALWAIPDNVITANTMGVINQNTGYDGADRNQPPLEVIE